MHEHAPFTFLTRRGRQLSARSRFVAAWGVNTAGVTAAAAFALTHAPCALAGPALCRRLGATKLGCCTSCIALIDVPADAVVVELQLLLLLLCRVTNAVAALKPSPSFYICF